MEYSLLKKIKGPNDLKKLKLSELENLAAEIREALFNRLTKVGGHFGPNFGAVELTIALHRVFESPKDQFVFDVAHQTYAHKMLTGRAEAYYDDAHFGDICGFTNPAESEHDMFFIGHTSTSVSLATGLAVARDLSGKNGNVIAIIGDGSLSGGEALEGLDYAGEMTGNLIIVVNDNEQSIAENHGGLYKNLKELRDSSGKCENNLFKAMGLDYMYVEEGNDICILIKAFESVKNIDHPIVVHVHTKKGKGYAPAEADRESWHYTGPFDRETGKSKWSGSGENYSKIFSDYMYERIQKDRQVVVVTAAVPGAVGLYPELRQKMGKQYIDVGIAEEHAVALCSGITKNGGKPVFVTNATFAQRTFDQMIQDAGLNNSPITLIINSSTVYGMSDATHNGLSALPLFSNIPDLIYLCPTCKEEYVSMLEWSLEHKSHPVVIATPGNGVKHTDRSVRAEYDTVSYDVICEGEKVAILALGDLFEAGKEAAAIIKKEYRFTPTLINPVFASHLDHDVLDRIAKNHKVIFTLEGGIMDGGFGQKVASYLGAKDIKVINRGFEKKYYDRYNPREILKELRLTPEEIAEDIKSYI